MTKPIDQKLAEHKNCDGNWALKNGGRNDVVQAVIQCLAATQIVKHMLKERYNRQGRQQYQDCKIFSSTLNRVFSEMWTQDREETTPIDIEFAATILG